MSRKSGQPDDNVLHNVFKMLYAPACTKLCELLRKYLRKWVEKNVSNDIADSLRNHCTNGYFIMCFVLKKIFYITFASLDVNNSNDRLYVVVSMIVFLF